MSDNSSNNKRIAKNTMLLYFRMIVTTLVSLYTARLTLILLGVEDYGVYNVVAGIVNFTGIIMGSMVQATQRFLSVDVGNKDMDSFKRTFSMTTNIFIIVCILCVLVLELVGPISIATFLTIPPGSMVAAQWIFQFALFDFVLTTMTIPYNAAIIAHERMNIYAYFTFLDIFLKLIVVLGLYFSYGDKLIVYGALGVVACVIRNIVIYYYCKKKVDGCTYEKFWDKGYFKNLSSYMGWSFLGSTSRVLTIQGQAIILNMFFGPVVNAAKAIADKINTIIYSFVSNFYMAVTPQIIKTYAVKDYNYTKKLVVSSSKIGFFLLLIVSIPLICNMKDLLYMWLGEEQVSSTMIKFCQLILVYSLVNALEAPITKVVQAHGEVKKYEIYVGVITLLFLPLCYLIFKLGLPAYSSIILLTIVYSIAHIYRVFYMSAILNITTSEYLITVLIPTIVVSLISYIVCTQLCIFNCFNNQVYDCCINLSIAGLTSFLFIVLLGLNKNERNAVLVLLRKKLKK